MRHKYTEEQIEWLKVNYPVYDITQLLPRFNERFNLNVTQDQLKTTLGRYQIKSGRTGQFEKGQESWNKGKKWDDYMSPESQANCLKTCFNSSRTVNNANHNEIPVGTEMLTEDGYVMVKLDKLSGRKGNRYWHYKHRVIWEQHHGTIPKGYKVIFADGDKYNFDINNLILVSDAELARMNHDGLYFKGNADATKVGHNIAKIKLRISEVENGCKEHTE